MVEDWLKTVETEISNPNRQVHYISIEYLMGRTLSNALISTGLYDQVKQALGEMWIDLDELCEMEADPGLGNEGLGRLAACFMDSLSTLGYPAWGYGLRYDYGMFKQCIIDNKQVEKTDDWLKYGFSWEFFRDKAKHVVQFGGYVIQEGEIGKWVSDGKVMAVAYDQIIPGYNTDTTNTLRLWSAHAYDGLDMAKFNQGDYANALGKKTMAENITSILYPDDSTEHGKVLRLLQEYLLVSATVQDIVHRHYLVYKTVDNLADKIAIHLNDTHPVLSIPELIRVLVTDYQCTWDKAWEMTQKIFSYTNHTLLSEVLECWPVSMIGKLLPQHLQIIYKINYDFLEFCKKSKFGDTDFIRRVSIIDEDNGRRVRMAWLAVIGSHKVNGVSKLHSNLMATELFGDFAKIWPDKFINVTNGVTPRRWIGIANPKLANLLNQRIGGDWRKNLTKLSNVKQFVNDKSFLKEFFEIKYQNKKRLANYVFENLHIQIDPNAMFDMQIKRIHEYKRQTLNLLHVIVRYNEILQNPDADWVPRVVFFSGKAAPGYVVAKGIIEIINEVAQVINNDARVKNKLKVVFIPNYSVSIAEMMIPAADLSEQISLAGYEASGTSNMKFILNGAIIIGTLDGANIEIKECVGDENIFIFGHTAEEVIEIRKHYDLNKYWQDQRIHKALTDISSGKFSPNEPNRFAPFLMGNFQDYYQNLADFYSYYNTQKKVDALYRDPMKWAKCAIMNIACAGMFSSDRSIQEYAEKIWNIEPINA